MQGEKSPDPQRAISKLLTNRSGVVKIGYARGTDKEPSLKAQLAALKKHGCKTIYSDSDTLENLDELERMLTSVAQGNIVCVQHLNRLGRTSYEIIKVINHLTEKQIDVVSLDKSIDTRTDVYKRQPTPCV